MPQMKGLRPGHKQSRGHGIELADEFKSIT